MMFVRNQCNHMKLKKQILTIFPDHNLFFMTLATTLQCFSSSDSQLIFKTCLFNHRHLTFHPSTPIKSLKNG